MNAETVETWRLQTSDNPGTTNRPRPYRCTRAKLNGYDSCEERDRGMTNWDWGQRHFISISLIIFFLRCSCRFFILAYDIDDGAFGRHFGGIFTMRGEFNVKIIHGRDCVLLALRNTSGRNFFLRNWSVYDLVILQIFLFVFKPIKDIFSWYFMINNACC